MTKEEVVAQLTVYTETGKMERTSLDYTVVAEALHLIIEQDKKLCQIRNRRRHIFPYRGRRVKTT